MTISKIGEVNAGGYDVLQKWMTSQFLPKNCGYCNALLIDTSGIVHIMPKIVHERRRTVILSEELLEAVRKSHDEFEDRLCNEEDISEEMKEFLIERPDLKHVRTPFDPTVLVVYETPDVCYRVECYEKALNDVRFEKYKMMIEIR